VEELFMDVWPKGRHYLFLDFFTGKSGSPKTSSNDNPFPPSA
jgi:hypothetical protein